MADEKKTVETDETAGKAKHFATTPDEKTETETQAEVDVKPEETEEPKEAEKAEKPEEPAEAEKPEESAADDSDDTADKSDVADAEKEPKTGEHDNSTETSEGGDSEEKKEASDKPEKDSDTDEKKKHHGKTIALVIVIILAILLAAIYCGIGGLYSQTYTDAFGRNAIFYDLVKLPWPTEYSPIDGNQRTLVYYFGFWLPAAGIAKICGHSIFVGEMVQLAYAVWGLWLITAFLFSYCRGRRRWLALLLLFFFAGWEVVETHFI